MDILLARVGSRVKRSLVPLAAAVTALSVAGVPAAGAATHPGTVWKGRAHQPRKAVTAPSTPAVAASANPMVTVFGAAGSFGAVGTQQLPDGKNVVAHPVPGWAFLPGQSVSGAVGTTDGSVVMGNEPQSGAQEFASANTMAVSVFNPASNRYENVVIPTSTGARSVLEPGKDVGGADVPALASDGDRVAFISASPYHGWDVDKSGEYPSFGYVGRSRSGTWGYVEGSGRSAATLGATAPPDTCVVEPTIYATPIADCRGPGSIGMLPASHDMVVSQYFEDPTHNRSSGGVMIVSPQGGVLTSFAYPNVSDKGVPLHIFPREVDVDPVSAGGIERFVIVFDTFGPDGFLPFTVQEFTYEASTKTVTAVSAPIRSGQPVNGAQSYPETAVFDHKGNLWVAESVMSGLSGGNLNEYSAQSVAGRLSSGECAATLTWSTTQFGMSCKPDVTITASAGQGMVRSIAEDSATGAVLLTTGAGMLVAVVPTTDALHPWAAKPPIDIGLNKLIDRWHSPTAITPRPGFVDRATHSLYIPIQQVETVAFCAPVGMACQQPPTTSNQWLYRVNLTKLLG